MSGPLGVQVTSQVFPADRWLLTAQRRGEEKWRLYRIYLIKMMSYPGEYGKKEQLTSDKMSLVV